MVWETAVGPGYAAPSVVAGRVYLNDYDEDQSVWMVRCLDLGSGDELWRYQVKKRIRPNHAITRSAPATDGGFVFAIDPKCELHCLDARNGELLWKKFLPAEYDSQIPAWYNGQCPLIDGDRLVIATGGRALMTALEKDTGEAIWETDNAEQFLLSHSSIMPVEIEGVRQYTYTTLKGLVGVDAESGKLLWHFPWKFNTAVASTPLAVGRWPLLPHRRLPRADVGVPGRAQRRRLGWPGGAQSAAAHRRLELRSAYAHFLSRSHLRHWQEAAWAVDLPRPGGQRSVDEPGRRRRSEWGATRLADGMFFVLEGKTGVLRVLDANADHYQELANCQAARRSRRVGTARHFARQTADSRPGQVGLPRHRGRTERCRTRCSPSRRRTSYRPAPH